MKAMDWRTWLGGDDAGATLHDLDHLSQRDRLSDYLPWLLYHEDDGLFLNADSTLGLAWECQPLLILGGDQLKTLQGLVASQYPEGTLIQFILYADPNIEPFIDAYRATRTRDHPLIQRVTEEYCRFLREGTDGLARNHYTPVRHYRLLVTLKMPVTPDARLVAEFEDSLRSAGLAPQRWEAGDLLRWARQFLNNSTDELATYQPHKVLAKQVLDPDQPYRFGGRWAQLGQDRYGVCLTPETLSDHKGTLDPLKTNQLLGGLIDQVNTQLSGPYLYTLNLFFGINTQAFNVKCSYMLNTRAVGTFSIQMRKRVDEFLKALDTLDGKNPLVRVLPVVWLWNRTEARLADDLSRLKGVWKSGGIKLRRERLLSAPLFIASLPFGLYDQGDNLKTLDRDFFVPSQTAACLLPVQGDFHGSRQPVVPFIGRKGQLVGINIFDRQADAYNLLVVAKTGGGKTFFLVWLLMNHFSAGAKVRLIDMGGGYKRLVQLFGGRYLDIGADTEDLCLNPFDFVESRQGSEQSRQEDRDSCIEAIRQVVGEMAYSASGDSPTESEWTLITQAIGWALDQGRRHDGLDAVAEYLRHYPQQASVPDNLPPDIIDSAHRLAFNLQDYTASGRYGHYFNGPSSLNIASDDLVVVELDRLREHRELCTVILMQIINIITQDLYLSDRSTPRFILFEEVSSLLSQQAGQGNFTRLTSMIDQGYMRARKYDGAFGLVIQSLSKLATEYPALADSVLTNTIHKFLLRNDYTKTLDDHLLHHQGLARELLESLEKSAGRYSEVFVDSDLYSGVLRLVVDDFTYWVNTSSGEEVARFEQLLAQGLSTIEAIETLSGTHLAPTQAPRSDKP